MTRAESSGGGSGAEQAAEAAETTLESFVAQLHSEGVEAGRREAEEVIRSAESEAEEILRRARAEADAYAEEAREAAEAAGARGRAELELAVRDAILQLQAALTAVLRTLIEREVDEQLGDPGELKRLIGDVVEAYASADASGRPTEFRVPARTARQLEGWWTRELSGAAGGGATLSPSLAAAGFEYDVAGGTVEVSVESVVDKLMELVRPGLREVVEEVASSAAAEAVPSGSAPPGLAGMAGQTT